MGNDRPGDASQARYIDGVLSELDRWVRPELKSDQSLFYYRSIRRVLAAFMAEAPAQPIVCEAPIEPFHDDVTKLSDRALHAAAREEGERLDAALARVDARLAKVDAAEDGVTITQEALQTCLRAIGYERARVERMRVVTGGRSKQTILFSAEGLTGLPRDLVMRRDIQTGTLGTAVVDEYALLKALHANGVNVPEPFICVEDRSLIGSPFLLMRAVAGATAGESVVAPSAPAQVLAAARALARIHRVPLKEVQTLPIFARAAANGDPLQEARSLYDIWRNQARGQSPIAEAAFRWLLANAPHVSAQRALVHGDYNFHNLLYDGDDLSAVLDWELSRLGHPAEDLGYIKQCAEQTVPWDVFMAAYREAGGFDVQERDVKVFALLTTLRLMSYILRSRAFFEAGNTDSIQKAEVSVHFMPRLLQQVSNELRDIMGAEEDVRP